MNTPTMNKRLKRLFKKITDAYEELQEETTHDEAPRIVHRDIRVRKNKED